jgi:hypothetical protein
MSSPELAGLLFTALGVGVLLLIAVRTEQRMQSRLGSLQLADGVTSETREALLNREVKRLRSEVDNLRNTVETLTRQLVGALDKIRALEMSQGVAPSASGDNFNLPELLVIFGPNATITARDKSGLRQEGIDFESLNQANRASIIDELVGRREDHRPLRWLHIASDAGPQGVLLSHEDGTPDIVEPEWWRQNITETEVIFVSACKGTKISNQLAALTEWLIYFREGVDNNDAGAFAGCFWGEVVRGVPVEAAYSKARQKVPAVRDFVAMRHRESVQP